MEAGHLVGDDIILGVVREELGKPEAAKGVIFDGVVRTIPQAEGVERLLAERDGGWTHVLFFDVTRRGDPRPARAAPARSRTAPTTTPRRWRPRLPAYREQTAPVLAWYEARGGVHRIPAIGTVEEIAGESQARRWAADDHPQVAAGDRDHGAGRAASSAGTLALMREHRAARA